jgi:uncharacterized protein
MRAGTLRFMVVEGAISSREPAALALRMRKHFGHKVPVEEVGPVTRITTSAGAFELEPAADRLIIRLEPVEDAALGRLREVVSSHLARFARGADAEIEWR